jgi:hypothetical protein
VSNMSSIVVCALSAAVGSLTVPSGSNGSETQSRRRKGGIYELLHWNALRRRDIHQRFHTDQSRHSEANMGNVCIDGMLIA